ncbi:hypothetical protein [Brachybacterium alimentarium]|uniref:hypothetical protein n=1 Tax=Brachybacterium alimentarium TaxID=47845 RepID=UPI003FD10EEF
MHTLPLSAMHPGARHLLLTLRRMAGGNGIVCETTTGLLEASGWTNRATLRRRIRELEDEGFIVIEPTYRDDGGRGPNVYRLTGKG